MTLSGRADKREYPRLNKKVVLQVAPRGEQETASSQWTLVTTKNISAGGVMFTYNRSLNEGTPLTLSIHFPEKTIRCAGVVHRTSPSLRVPLVQVAARLEGFHNGDREFIERYPA